jgi:UDP:flavonoid glycosyltransferase YjiC (YdhE family)
MNENAARLDWAGAGVRLPWRFVKPRPLRLAVEKILSEPSIKARAGDLAAWIRANDPGATAAALVEQLAQREPISSARPASSSPAQVEQRV